ncbi:MAG: hypothetical protein M1503_04460 [Thaumarchaeota archaeon]|nr:hypothetical protein [Nitrososphaerota archaeon]MCL5317502.1 hypothetical protein [Nitrososphaerota archaeon]
MSIIRILSLKRQFERTSKMNSREVESIQQNNIQVMVNHAISKSAFYRQLYGDKKPDRLLENGLEPLPTIDKQTVMDNFDNVTTDPRLKRAELEQHLATAAVGKRYRGKFVAIHTSGTSGKIGIFTYDSLGWDTLKALVLARCTNFGIGPKRKRMAFVGLTDGHYAGVTFASSVPRILAAYTDASVNEPTTQIVSRLNRFRPDDLRSYASGLVLLASEQLAGRLDIHPTNIVSSAEPLDDKARHIIEEAFGVTPYNFYAASESIGIAQDCSEHQGLHVFNDQHVLELLNEKNEPVKPGHPGQVVLTNLYNRCQPLIRYRMNDIAIYSDEECDCGLPFPLLKSIIGRQEEVIWVENNHGGYETIHPMVFIEFFVPGLKRLQVLQEERNRLRLKLVTDGDKDAILTAVTRRMEEILSGKNLLGHVTFELEPVNLISPDRKTGKTKMVISAVGPPKET